ncbi:MAG: 50S ribosomal protein L35 [SAR202 cluster bacterium]|nr:50S ribosomal protein L35 [SAR202 cluster bacterium]
MPKLKTHSGAKKRFHVTGSGKFLRMKGHSSHLRRKKTSAVKQQYDRKQVASGPDQRRLAKVLPYGR